MPLDLAEAAKVIGVPANALAATVWAGNGPKTVGGKRYAQLQFEKADLVAWAETVGRKMAQVIGPGEPVWPVTKPRLVVRRR